MRKHGYPREVIHAVEELIKRLDIRLVQNIYTGKELYEALLKYRLLTQRCHNSTHLQASWYREILTFDEDFKRVSWLTVLP